MTRVGISAWHEDPDSLVRVVEFAESIHTSPVAILDGVYTHFPRADEDQMPGTGGHALTFGQIETMRRIVRQLAEKHVPCRKVHMANTAGIEAYPESYEEDWITHVRPGALLYGFSEHTPMKFQRVLSWTTSLARVERVERDLGVGYGGSHQAKAGDYIGTLTVGYADGYRRPAKDRRHWVQVEDVVVPVIGGVAMNMCMVDMNPYVARYGRVPEPHHELDVILMTNGPNGDFLSADQIGGRCGTDWWILLSGIRTRNETRSSVEEKQKNRG